MVLFFFLETGVDRKNCQLYFDMLLHSLEVCFFAVIGGACHLSCSCVCCCGQGTCLLFLGGQDQSNYNQLGAQLPLRPVPLNCSLSKPQIDA